MLRSGAYLGTTRSRSVREGPAEGSIHRMSPVKEASTAPVRDTG